VSEDLLRRLGHGLGDHDAFLPQSDGRRGVEPLCAGYGPACRDAIAYSLDQGDLRAIAFHERIGVGILPLSQVAGYGDPELLFFNVNTTDDLARTDELWRRLDSSPSSAGRTPEKRR
jgi:molybdopterin-guanine dinucleotide biosynthesis protein A